MAEEAYAKATDDKDRHAAAGLRSLLNKDIDDEIEWLRKADTAFPATRARLAGAMGDKAASDGRDADALTQYRLAIAAYEAMPRDAITFNQTACAWFAIFGITGDRQAFDRCVEGFQRAVELAPTDAILLGNAGGTILNAAMDDVISTDIDLRAIRQPAGFGLLSYLYRDQAGRNVVARRLTEHPGVARAPVVLPKAHGRLAQEHACIRHGTRDPPVHAQ